MHYIIAHFRGNVINNSSDSSISPLYSIASYYYYLLLGSLSSYLLLKVVITFIEIECRLRSTIGSENS